MVFNQTNSGAGRVNNVVSGSGDLVFSTIPNKPRRLKRVDATSDIVLSILTDGDHDLKFKVSGGLPRTARVVDAEFLSHDLFRITFEDDSFEEVPEGAVIPLANPSFSRIES